MLTEQQAACGIFLKLHIMEKTVRRFVVPVHSVIGKAFPLLGWTREFSTTPYLSECVEYLGS